MVGFAKAHHPSNCLPLNNRNRIGDDGNVAANAKEFTTFSTVNGSIIDSTSDDGDDSGQSNCERWLWQKRRSRRCIINDNNIVESNNCRRVNVRIYHGNRKKTVQDARNGMWFRVRTIMVNSCNLSVSVVFCAAISLLLLNIDVINAEPQQTTEQQCEPKVLDENPPDPVIFFFFL